MKTAIYIEDGVVQLVITPESEFEKNALSSLREKPIDAKLYTGSFYDCRGGWVRQSAYFPKCGLYTSGDGKDDSLILVSRERPKDAGPQPPDDPESFPDDGRYDRGCV